MRRVDQFRNHLLLLCLCIGTGHSVASAGSGHPLAIRRWRGGAVTIETQWGLSIRVHPSPQPIGQAAANANSASEPDPGRAAVFPEVDQNVTADADLDHVLARLPNESESTWMRSEAWKMKADGIPEKLVSLMSMVHVKTLANGTDGRNLLQVSADGVTMVFVPSSGPSEDASLPKHIDLLVVSAMNHEALPPKMIDAWRTRTKPKFILINVVEGVQAAADPTDPDSMRIAESATTIADTIAAELQLPVSHVTHNAMALSTTTATAAATKLLTLAPESWQMEEEMDVLFDAMEASSAKSQAVFETLTVQQLNFRPSNGTHTPRWNSEHMMGRQLLFFSQIYHQIDRSVPVMDLNPKQMPNEYELAHPHWTGAEEARQTVRVSEFTRRFAYLLDGMAIAEPAPGSRWPSLAALLKQMDRHYSEHTANTVKKFDLPDWPDSPSVKN